MTKRTWTNAPGELLTEVNLVLPFLSSGYYDPGSTYGGLDRMGWPPEGDDERLPDGLAILDFGKDGKVELTAEQTNQLADILRTEMYEVELEPEEDGR